MTEKRFYHQALQDDLLSGKRLKAKLDAQLFPTKEAAAVPVREAAPRFNRIIRWAAVPAAAVLLVLTLGIGAFVASRGLRGTQIHAEQPLADGTSEAVEPNAVLSESSEPTVRRQAVEIKLLPEFDPEHLIDQMRINHLNLSAFDEADWKWLREMQVQVTALSIQGDCVHWTVELRIDKDEWTENPFLHTVDVHRNEPHCFYTDADGNLAEDPRAKLVDLASPGEAAYGDDEDEWVMRIPCVCLLPQVDERLDSSRTVQFLMLLLDPQAEHGDESYVMLAHMDEMTGERTPYVGSDELVPISLIGTAELTFTFEDDGHSAAGPFPTPEAKFTPEPTAWSYPSDEALFVPAASQSATATPHATPNPTPEPTSAHENTPQVYENGQRVYDGFMDTELFLAGWDTVSDELCSIRLAFDPEQYTVTVTDGKRTSEDLTAHIEPEPVGLKRAILMQLDPDKQQRDLILVIAVENGTYVTFVMHPEGDAIVVTKRLDGECIWDGTSLVLFERTVLLGDGTGWRRYSGESMTPASDWLVCESSNAGSLDHVAWLCTVRDLPCTIDGQSAVIEAGTRLYRTRFNNAKGLAEVCTETGTIAVIAFDGPDSDFIGGVSQEAYFENLPFSN